MKRNYNLPPWITTNLRSRKSWKLLLRCWLASWISFIIILPQKSLATLGQAAFFALLASTMMPPNLPFQIFTFMLSTMIVGILIGWAFGCAAMRAALASRSQVLLRASLQKEATSAAGLSNPDALFEASIFAAEFLDPRSSAVFGCFLGFVVFLFALLRAYIPRLTLMSIFGTIAIDVFCCYGPLFPFAQYTLMYQLLIPTSCYVAIGFILITFVFPETLNHAELSHLTTLLTKMKDMMDLQQVVLNAAPEDLAPGTPLLVKVIGLKEGVIGLMQMLTGQLQFINLEFTWGKWNGDDIKALCKPLQAVVSKIAGAHVFAGMVGKPTFSEFSAAASRTNLPSSDPSLESVPGDSHLIQQLREHFVTAEAAHGVRMADILPVLRDVTAELRAASSLVLGALAAVVEDVNTHRYARGAGASAESERLVGELDASTERLRRAMDDFKMTQRLALIVPFERVLEEAKNTPNVPLRALYHSYVFAGGLMVAGESILRLAEAIGKLAQKRKRSRLWAPKGLRMFGKLLASRHQSEGEQLTGESTPPEEQRQSEREERKYKLDPDSKPPTNPAQRFMNLLHAAYKWCKTPEAMFGFKNVIVTIALWLPAVISHSGKFYYAQKGMWALIMAQTTLNVYASDQIYNYVMRVFGTFVGGVYGLLCWYIGSANGNGNAYGVAASVAVFLVPLIFCRLYAPPQSMPFIFLVGATYTLVVGYSWIDGHLPIFSNVGIGWSIAWRRFTLVIIGCVASFVLMMFPPSSGRKAVRVRNASTIASLSFLYAHLMAAWINETEPAAADKDKSDLISSAEWLPEFRERFIGLSTQMSMLRTQTNIAKWEGNVRGAWPYEEYMQLVTVQSNMVTSLAMLGGSLEQLDRGMRIAFLQHTKVVNPNFISEVMSMFLLISQSLRTGEPLHQAQSQNLLDRLHYHGQAANLPGKTPVDGTSVPAPTSPLQSVTSYEYMFYASGVVAVFQLIGYLNELRRITARLCGEVKLEGFEQWKEKYELAHTA
ncbi:hypothetical protein B0H21DRAFT_721769 [Amylocystis lapponica]|nr:hypothetical protein B0H21DRAFT_721769 [Amylocystis lapponica]